MRAIQFLTLLSFLAGISAPAFAADDMTRWKAEAGRVDIVRDDWGIAHVHGKTDADAVFGMVYAQAEDDFNRVETNYITALGRTAEAEGETAIWQDLRQKLFIDPVVLKADYAKSPAWLKALMDAWADGLNYYLATHPAVKPRVIAHFEPWMALSFTEGSIGGDIERVKLSQLESFYGKQKLGMTDDERGLVYHEPRGSNGIAIAPSDTRDGHALLLINPHTTFFFRSELQMIERCGARCLWRGDVGAVLRLSGLQPQCRLDAHLHGRRCRRRIRRDDRQARRQTMSTVTARSWRPVTERKITVPYRKADGAAASRTFTAYFTHHGPIVREADGKWIAMALMNTPIPALEQSYLRTKTSDYASYMKVAALKANSSNNTIFADSKGEIAYLHPQFVPLRDDRFDYTRPVDGSDPATDWKGLTPLDKLPSVANPPNGWVFNTNDWPYVAAGPYSPKRRRFPELHGYVRRKSARPSRHADADAPQGFHAGNASGRRVRSLPCRNSRVWCPNCSRPMTRCRRAIR